MGNEENSNSNHKILTDQSSFNKSNLREIQDSNSESKIKKENEKNNSSSSIENSKEEEYEADEEVDKSKEKLKNINNDIVEYTFIWEEKCNIAKVIGSFNNWKEQLIMTYDPKDNLYKFKLELKRDKYEYKFIIDNSWQFSKYQETRNDGKGNINNFIDLTNYNKQINDIKKTKKIKKKKKKKKKEKIEKVESFGVLFPTKEELNTEAPITQELYLKSFFINEATNQNNIGEKNYFKYSNRESYTEEKSYRNLLFSPHVNLNHTMSFCDNKDILQVGLSYRFRNKDCTLVYYSRLKQ